MNATASLIRHFLTYLAGLGGFLFAHGVIPADSVPAADQAGAALVEPLAVIAGLLAAAVLRLAIFCLGKIFPASAGKFSGASGGMPLLLVGMTTAAVMGSLPSCSADQLAAASKIPMRACVATGKGTVCYSSQSGLEARIDAGSNK